MLRKFIISPTCHHACTITQLLANWQFLYQIQFFIIQYHNNNFLITKSIYALTLRDHYNTNIFLPIWVHPYSPFKTFWSRFSLHMAEFKPQAKLYMYRNRLGELEYQDVPIQNMFDWVLLSVNWKVFVVLFLVYCSLVLAQDIAVINMYLFYILQSTNSFTSQITLH